MRKVEELVKVMSWLKGLTQDDWREFYSDSEVQNIAKSALELLKDQDDEINTLKILVLGYENGII